MSSEAPPTKRSETTQKKPSGAVQQFSIFLRNRVGAFLDVVRLLADHHVNVLATSIESSSDTAIVRIVVSDPESVEGIFHLHSIPHAVSPLIVVEMKEASQLGEILGALLAAEVNIFGSYALLTRPNGLAALALHVEDYDCGASVLKAARFAVLDQGDVSR
ncbi:MAG: hypothetical protein RL088_38 [Verrucomicrobiota bacterium]|jgi:hypothetical protein